MGLVLRQGARHPGQDFTIFSLYNQYVIVFDNIVFFGSLLVTIEIKCEERSIEASSWYYTAPFTNEVW